MNSETGKPEERDKELRHINRLESYNEASNSRTVGWQVRFHRNTGYISKLFSDGVHGGSEGALLAAKTYRDEVLNRKNEELGSYRRNRTFVLPDLPRANTSGILGVNRSSRTERNGTRFSYWQATYSGLDKKPINRSFSINKYGELRALISAISFRKSGVESYVAHASNDDVREFLHKQIRQYLELLEFLESITLDETDYLLAYLADKALTATSKKQLVESRVSQKIFRTAVIEHWGGVCAATGAEVLIIASHIKPWAASKDAERMDVHNGIALSPTYDKAFDRGFITFDSDGRIKLASQFKKQAHLLGICDTVQLSKYNFRNDRYMSYHRRELFLG